MDKTKAATGQQGSSKKPLHAKNKGPIQLKENARVREINPTEELLNAELVNRAIEECLKENDTEGMLEVIQIYLEVGIIHYEKKRARIVSARPKE